jgi:protein NirF
MKTWLLLSLVLLLSACAQSTLRGTGDLGVVIERANGRVAIVDTTAKTVLGHVDGLGDLSHASVVYSRDSRYAYVFGRDGGLTKVDVLGQRIERRIIQAGNSIGGAISQDGRLVVAQNYVPGGIKVFDAATLELLSEVRTDSKVVGLADLPGQKFAYALFDKGEIWISDLSDPRAPRTQKFPAGLQPYDGLVTPDGRYYLAGLFGEDGIALLDTWRLEKGASKILRNYGKGEEKLPVFKMPHLRGWAVAGEQAYLPAIGRHEVLVVDKATWQEVRRIPVKSQPVFVMARPDGRQVWVNFAHPDNGWIQVIDTLSGQVVKTLQPGKAILHMEFTPRGENVWLSARDDNSVAIYDTQSFERIAGFPAQSPSGIFFSSRAHRIGF